MLRDAAALYDSNHCWRRSRWEEHCPLSDGHYDAESGGFNRLYHPAGRLPTRSPQFTSRGDDSVPYLNSSMHRRAVAVI